MIGFLDSQNRLGGFAKLLAFTLVLGVVGTGCKTRQGEATSRDDASLAATTRIDGRDEDLTRFRQGPNYITQEEANAFRLYSSEQRSPDGQVWYKTLNNALRERNAWTISRNAALIRNIASFVNKNRGPGCSFRRYLDVNYDLQRKLARRGQRFVEAGFFSTTANTRPPAGFAAKSHIIVGTSSSCANVARWSAYPQENEVLFPPGSEFEVTQDQRGNTFFLRELEAHEIAQGGGSNLDSIAPDDDWDARMRSISERLDRLMEIQGIPKPTQAELNMTYEERMRRLDNMLKRLEAIQNR